MHKFQFKTPALVQLIGPSCSGKSTLIRSLVEKADEFFDRPFDQIIYACGVPLKDLPQNPKLIVIDGPPNPEMFDNDLHQLCILDDLMEYFSKNKDLLSEMFTKIGHHKNCSIINVCQSIFKQERTARINSNYIILTRTSDRLSLSAFGRQIGQCKFLLECYDDIVRNSKTGYPHMVLDLHPTTDDRLRIVTDILSDPLYYVSNSLRR